MEVSSSEAGEHNPYKDSSADAYPHFTLHTHHKPNEGEWLYYKGEKLEKHREHTNCLSHQLGGNRRINAAADGTNNLSAIANKVSDASNLILDEVFHLPIGLGSADLGGEVA